jgi:hypothetical protein
MLLVAVFAFSAAGYTAVADGDDDLDSWNILVYLQADNNLNDLTQTDLDEFMNVGSSPEVNVLVFMDKLDDVAHLYYVVPGDMVLLDYKYNGVEVNTGDPVVFEEFVTYAEDNYAAEHTLIFFWDHGGPTSGVGMDDTTPEGVSDWLTHQELITALEGHTVDVLAMDECSIGQIDVMYEYAMGLDTEYVVASESYIGYRGFPYDWILARLVTYPNMTTYDLSLVCVQEFQRLFMSTPYMSEIMTTQSVIDLSMIEPLANALTALTDLLSADIAKYSSAIKYAQAQAVMPWGARSAGRIDLPTFVEGIGAKAPGADVQTAVEEFMALYEQAVPAMGVTKNSDIFSYQGLGTLFPPSSSMLTVASAAMFEKYKMFDFADNGWLQFLEAYWGVDLI